MDLTLESKYGNVGKRPLANTKENEKKKVKLDPGIKVKLPDEMWMKIMGYLNCEDLFQNVNLVNRHFYNIHRSAAKYLEVKDIEKKEHFEMVIKVLSNCKSLKIFKIDGNYSKMSYMDGIIKQALISCQNIKTLMVLPDQFNDSDRYIVFEDEIRAYKNHLNMETIGTFGKKLEHLVLNDVEIISEHFLSNLTELKTLRLTAFQKKNSRNNFFIKVLAKIGGNLCFS